jgi:hypothetical protein
LLQIEPEKPKTPGISFGQACERYLAAKSRKRSLENDTRIVKHLKAELGADTPLGEITARRIGEYRSKRLAAVRTVGAGEKTTERPLTAAAINRPLALLRHLLEAKLDDFHSTTSGTRSQAGTSWAAVTQWPSRGSSGMPTER